MQKLIEENVQVIIIHWCFHPFFSQNSSAYFRIHARIFKDLKICSKVTIDLSRFTVVFYLLDVDQNSFARVYLFSMFEHIDGQTQHTFTT
jgi:hypothetical protein